jgi:mono/diheme cytochrome c family protein
LIQLKAFASELVFDEFRRSTTVKGANVMVSSVISVEPDDTVQDVVGLKLLGACLVLGGTVMGEPASAADVYNGGQIAHRWCEPCHVVSTDQRGTTGEAPPFSSIAKKPGFDAGQLAVFLLDPHPKMPNMSLTRIEAGDLAAYIASLGK